MDQLYREHILDHYKHPRNFGRLTSSSASASDNIVSCGDSLVMDIQVRDGKLTEIAFEGKGCAISMASASMLTDYAKNKSVVDLKRLGKDDILALLGIELTLTRLQCGLLSLEVLHKALHSYPSSAVEELL